MIDVVVPHVGVVDAGDVLHVDDGVGEALLCDGVPHHALDTRMYLEKERRW